MTINKVLSYLILGLNHRKSATNCHVDVFSFLNFSALYGQSYTCFIGLLNRLEQTFTQISKLWINQFQCTPSVHRWQPIRHPTETSRGITQYVAQPSLLDLLLCLTIYLTIPTVKASLATSSMQENKGTCFPYQPTWDDITSPLTVIAY